MVVLLFSRCAGKHIPKKQQKLRVDWQICLEFQVLPPPALICASKLRYPAGVSRHASFDWSFGLASVSGRQIGERRYYKILKTWSGSSHLDWTPMATLVQQPVHGNASGQVSKGVEKPWSSSSLLQQLDIRASFDIQLIRTGRTKSGVAGNAAQSSTRSRR